MANRDELLFHAKCAEQAERYSDMVNDMRKLVKLTNDLTSEERNLFSLAYKNLLLPKRNSIRIINAEIEKAEEEYSKYLDIDKMYRDVIEAEIRNLSHGMIQLIEKGLIKPDCEPEAKAFYLKLKGDYFRYLAEFEHGNDKNDAAECSLEAYKEAYEHAVTTLPPTNPIRLGVALNFSVFYYEVAKSADRACKLAKQAFDDAIAELDNLSEESYKDSSLVMQLIRDNLALWISEMQKGETSPRN